MGAWATLNKHLHGTLYQRAQMRKLLFGTMGLAGSAQREERQSARGGYRERVSERESARERERERERESARERERKREREVCRLVSVRPPSHTFFPTSIGTEYRICLKFNIRFN
jgi:hypothetical protein